MKSKKFYLIFVLTGLVIAPLILRANHRNGTASGSELARPLNRCVMEAARYRSQYCSAACAHHSPAVATLDSSAPAQLPWLKKKSVKPPAKNKKKAKKEPSKEEKEDATPQYVQAQPDEATIAKMQARPANGSLFTADAQGTDLLGDFRARRIGDLVFVDVIEGSSASVSSSAKRSRDSGTLGGLVTAAGAIPTPGAAVIAGAAGALGNRKFEGKGNTERTSDLRSRIAARVIEVLPNGDLRIEALKSVRINQETEKLLLSGIIRQRDLTSDNVVPTTAVGDLRVELNGKGVASADNAPGWLFRFFEKITPF